MNNILRYHPWQHVRKAMLNKKLYPPSIIHTRKKIKQPYPIPQKESDKKSERNNDSKNPPTKKKPIGVIYF